MPIDLNVSEYVQELSITLNDESWSIREFVGASPILVRNPETLVILVQSGRAMTIGNRHFMVAPAPLFPSRLTDDKPRVNYKRLTSLKFETTWTYAMWLTTLQATELQIEAATAWPTAPTFTSA